MIFYLSGILARINYASSQYGTYIIESSSTLERVSASINTREDRYMIGTCTKSFIKIKLPNELRVKSVEIQNCECLSSFVSKVRLTGNINVDLGTYTLKATRKNIVINVDSKEYFSELYIEFVEFYGVHNWFTVTHIKVFGSTMFEDMIAISKKKMLNTLGLKGECPLALVSTCDVSSNEVKCTSGGHDLRRFMLGAVIASFVTITSKKIYDKIKNKQLK